MFWWVKSGAKATSFVLNIFLVVITIPIPMLIGLREDYGYVRVVIDFFSILLPFLIFFLVVNSRVKVDLNVLANWIVAFGLLSFFSVYFLKHSLGLKINLTIAHPLIALAVGWFLVNKKIMVSVVVLFASLMLGKRSVFLFSIIVFFFIYMNYLSKNLSYERIISVFLVLLTIFVSLMFSWDFLVSINPKLEKLELMFNSEVADYRFSTGRLDEIKSLYQTYDFYDYFLGAGLGSSFEVYIPEFNIYKEENYLHFSPLTYHLKVGILGFIFVYYFLLKIAFCSGQKSFLVFIYIFFYVSFYSLTSFSFAVDMTFWILAGVFCSRRPRLKSQPQENLKDF